MTAATWIAIWGVCALIAGLLGNILAGMKNRDRSAWMAWGFLVPPSVLLLWLLPRGDRAPRKRRSSGGDEDSADIEDILGDRSD